MTCVTLIDKKLVEQDGKYEKVVGASYTRYKLSELGKKVLKEIRRQEAK